MPIKQCSSNGKPGFKWGNSGKCYTYTPGNKQSMEAARKKAQKQGAAAHASGYRGSLDKDTYIKLFKVLSNIQSILKNINV